MRKVGRGKLDDGDGEYEYVKGRHCSSDEYILTVININMLACI